MREKNLMKILAISVVVVIVTSCIAPGIAGDNSANNTSSNRSEEFNTTRTMIPSLMPSPFYAKHLPADNTTMHVHPQKLFRHEIYMPDDAYASFSVRNNTRVRSNNDTITSGLQLVQYEYALSVYNTNDTSDTVLGNLVYTLHADNIVDVYDKEYAEWNESYVKWVFPSDYVLVEDDWLWTGAESSFFEIKYIPISLGRKVNNSIFNADGYQLAEFNVTYDNLNFDYSGGLVIAKEDSLVNASFLPDTFSTDAPLLTNYPFSKKTEHEIHFNLADKSQLQANKTYNFSVVVRVDLKGDNPSPILYKPKFEIWIGHDTISAPGPIGRNVTIPSEMLPEHVHLASASTNVTNRWTLLRLDLLVATLDKISEPYGVNIRSKQDFMERKYVANGSFSSSLSDMIYRLDLRIYANSGQFVVPRVVIFNTTSINLDRTFYKVDGVSMGHGNITAFPDHIEWTGNNETVSSYFELGIYELNTQKLTPPFSSSRSVEKEVFDGNETITMTFNATPTDNLTELDFRAFAEETNDAYSEFLVDTATKPEFIKELSSEMIHWRFKNPVIGQTYSASVNLTVKPKTCLATRYWPYLKVEGDYGSFTYSTSGSSQSMVEYTDSILGDVQIYFENPVDYTIEANGKGTYFERFKQFSEIVEGGEPDRIGITRNAYKPGIRTVPSGATVKWTNWEDLVHTVTSDIGLWDSGSLSDGQSFSYTFNTLGTYTYHDALHPSVTGVVKVYPTDFFFDTGKGTYPSIMGRHEGTITPSRSISVSRLYTYPCTGTGGHSEYVAFYYPNGTLIAEANWTGYSGDWHNISFLTLFSLEAGKAYNYTIRTGSYPQIHHAPALPTTNGWINCTQFVDANGKEYNDWIPAIRLWGDKNE